MVMVSPKLSKKKLYFLKIKSLTMKNHDETVVILVL